jgi:hypothetical protein
LVGIAVYLSKKKLNIDKITFHDGCFYEEGEDLDEYFSKRVEQPKVHQCEGNNLNSSRNLKSDNDNGPQKDTQAENVLILTANANKSKQDQNEVDLNNVNTNDKESGHPDTVIYKKITYNDYSKIPPNKLVEYDKRGFVKYIKDELIHNHCIIKVFLKHSLIDTRLYASLQLILKVNLIFGLNALAITDNMIEARAMNPFRVYITIT